MPSSARLTDLAVGVCICHDSPMGMVGHIITGSPNVKINGLQSARLTDTVLGACGHTGTIVSASGNVIVNGLGDARIGDAVVG